jgi:hypothetical protein|tara:strand:+ start:509 stop:775 length:267 start_codon:yes stop_codon:yes gene_type:complete
MKKILSWEGEKIEVEVRDMHRVKLLKALESKYQAEMDENNAMIEIILDKPVGISDHTKLVDELDNRINKIKNAEDKLSYVKRIPIDTI